MFAATTKKSFLLTDPAQTCDVLEEAVNLAFEGRPGPVHIHVPENLTHPASRSTTTATSGLTCGRSCPIPRGSPSRGGCLAEAIRRQARARADRLRRDPQRRRARSSWTWSSGSRSPSSPRSTARASSARDHPLALGDLLATAATGAPGRRSTQRRPRPGRRQFVRPARDLRLPPRPLRRQDAHPRQHRSAIEIDKVYKADYALVSDAKPAIAALAKSSPGRT